MTSLPTPRPRQAKDYTPWVSLSSWDEGKIPRKWWQHRVSVFPRLTDLLQQFSLGPSWVTSTPMTTSALAPLPSHFWPYWYWLPLTVARDHMLLETNVGDNATRWMGVWLLPSLLFRWGTSGIVLNGSVPSRKMAGDWACQCCYYAEWDNICKGQHSTWHVISTKLAPP